MKSAIQLMVVCLVLSLVVPQRLLAQSTGSISGKVQDPTGALIPGADITARNVATNLTYKANCF